MINYNCDDICLVTETASKSSSIETRVIVNDNGTGQRANIISDTRTKKEWAFHDIKDQPFF